MWVITFKRCKICIFIRAQARPQLFHNCRLQNLYLTLTGQYDRKTPNSLLCKNLVLLMTHLLRKVCLHEQEILNFYMGTGPTTRPILVAMKQLIFFECKENNPFLSTEMPSVFILFARKGWSCFTLTSMSQKRCIIRREGAIKEWHARQEFYK